MILSVLPAADICIAVLLIILSYLLGSIPFGLVIGKTVCKKDIRLYGSKNIGSTNAIRVLGKKIGFIVFFLDVFKGMAVILLIYLLEATGLWHNPEAIDLFFYGAPAIIGHCFSIFLNFKGGKAVATSLGVVLVLTPVPAIACLIVFLIVLYSTGYVSLASTGATLTVIITTWILYCCGIEDVTHVGWYLIAKPTLTLTVLYSVLSLLILFKHIKNYKRLSQGTESNFKKKKALEPKH